MKQAVFDYIKKTYDVLPEYPWARDRNCVFRHGDNRKWFAIIQTVTKDKLGYADRGPADVLNVKVDDPFFRDAVMQEEGILPGYHMNKRYWISILLDGTVGKERVFELLDLSFEITREKKAAGKRNYEMQT